MRRLRGPRLPFPAIWRRSVMRRLWLCLWLIPVSLLATERTAFWPDARYEPSIPTAESVLGAAIGVIVASMYLPLYGFITQIG